MGAGEFLKDIYYAGEEKWYAFWDRVDSAIPVYKIIDPIDNTVPSFALFLIIIALILLLAVGGLLSGSFSPFGATLQVSVVDSDGAFVSGAKVTIEGIDEELYTNDFGLVDSVSVPFNTTLSVTAQKGDKTTTVPVIIDSFSKSFQITLPVHGLNFAQQKTISFRTADGELILGELSLQYTCSSGEDAVSPASDVIFGGTANVSQTDDCGTLSVTVRSPRYTQTTCTAVNAATVCTLTPSESGARVKATVNLKYNGQLITDPVAVSAYLGTNPIPSNTITAVNGQAQFELIEGSYTFKTNQQLGYKAGTSLPVTLSAQTGQQTVNINLEKNFLGLINVKVVEGATPQSGVLLTLQKISGDTATPVLAKDSNSGGMAQFEIAEDGNYIVVATKDNYCPASVNAKIGDSKTIVVKKYDGTCGSKLRARIVNQDGKPVSFAKTAIFAETSEDSYKLPYAEKVTDFNGYVEWNPVKNSNANEKYKVFAFKATYSGWSEAKALNANSALEPYIVTLQVPAGIIHILVKDADGVGLQFSEVQLFDDYATPQTGLISASGKKIIENLDGTIDFSVSGDKRVYAVIQKEGYESYTTLPVQVIGTGTVNIDVTLSKPPVAELQVRPLGLYKNGSLVAKVEPKQEYLALFEITAPAQKNYDQLGFFMLTGKDNITKTELDKVFIKEAVAPGLKIVTTGATYNAPRGYDSTDSKYLNLEESKWVQVIWSGNGFTAGKIIVGVKVKVRQTAQPEERLDIGYRAWGINDGDYERDRMDAELGTNESSSTKQALYAALKWEYITVGTETLCETQSEDKSFCITASYTDPDGFTNSFTDSFDAKNNSKYNVAIRIMNNSRIGFDNAKLMIENPEENLLLGELSLVTPQNVPINLEINGYETGWIETPDFKPSSPIDILNLEITPQKTGSGTLKVRIRDNATLVFEKEFALNISSSKKMTIQYLSDGKFVDEMPRIISGKVQTLTVKAINATNALEIEDASVKLYDRFGTLLFEKLTNKLGVAEIQIPASFPSEKLKLQIEAPDYETFAKEFTISEDVVTVAPATLNFTVNPQTKKEDVKTVKVSNQTGLDLYVKDIKLTGKLKGLLNEAQIEAWFETFKGRKIASQDYEEIPFKVISSPAVPTAEDIDAEFEITVGTEGKEWVQEIPTKIRVGLGKDVDNQSCLEATQTNWASTTRGQQVQISLEVRNNCTVEGKPVSLTNFGATVGASTTLAGTFNAQTQTSQVELGMAFARILKPTVLGGEKIPVTISFTPLAGSSGSASGSIIFEALNKTDSKPQKVTAELKYTINYENLQECIVVGADQVVVEEEGTGSFSITNSCKTKTDIVLDPIDLHGAINNKVFSLNAGESKDVQIVAAEGEVPGAYNVLINAKQAGTMLETARAIKLIIEPKDSCFALSRYVYDIYDSPANAFDGTDRGYLRNNCVEKNVSASVKGTIPYDSGAIMKMMLWGALVGGATGYFKNDKFWPDSLKNSKWFNSLFGSASDHAQEAYIKESQRTAAYSTLISTKRDKAKNNIDQSRKDKEVQLNAAANDLIKDLDAKKKTALDACNAGPQASKQSCIDDVEKRYVAAKAKIDQVRIDAVKQVNDAAKEFEPLEKQLNEKLKTAASQAQQKNNAQASQSAQIAAKGGLADKDIETEVSKLALENVQAINGQINDLVKTWDEKAAKYDELIKKRPEEFGLVASLVVLAPVAGTQTTAAVTPPQGVTQSTQNCVPGYYYDPDVTDSESNCIGVNAQEAEDAATKKLAEAKQNPIGPLPQATGDPQVPGSVDVGSVSPFGPTPQTTSPNTVNYQLLDSKVYNGRIVTAGYSIQNESASGFDIVGPGILGRESWLYQNGRWIRSYTGLSGAPEQKYYTDSFDEVGADYGIIGRSIGGYTVDQFKLTAGIKPEAQVTADYSSGRFIVGNFTYTSLGNGTWELYDPSGISSGIYSSDLKTRLSDLPAIEAPSPYARTQSQFLLAAPQTGSANNTGMLVNMLLGTGAPWFVGQQMGSGFGGAVSGALINGFLSWMQAQDTPVNYSDTFTVPMVEFDSATLTSPDGIGMSVGEATYDYDSYNGLRYTGSTGSSTGTGSDTSNAYTGNILYNPQALSATLGEVEVRELDFNNKQPPLVQKDQRKPYAAVLTVKGTENVYETAYDYSDVEKAEKASGNFKENKGNFLSDFFSTPKHQGPVANLTEENLKVKEVRNYEKKFHLLFESWQYVSCGPGDDRPECQPQAILNCDVDGKKGVTGIEGVPRILLDWSWGAIDEDSCDTVTNPDRIYCDSTQLTIETLKKLLTAKNFFTSSKAPTECPSSIDILGTRTQTLSDNALDVGITSVQTKETTTGADIIATVETNNNLSMSANVSFKITDANGTVINNACAAQTKSFTSRETFTCSLNRDAVGLGTKNVDVTMTPQLCDGCSNASSTNDKIQTALVLGSTSARQCLKFSTDKEYFEKVLAANNLLGDSDAQKVLGFSQFKLNLLRDAYSEDFKQDFAQYYAQFLASNQEFKDSNLLPLFESDKFKVTWPTLGSSAWEAGIYDAKLIITFNNNSWQWSNDNIKSIELKLDPQGDPDPNFEIYNVAFNGMVGLNSSDGRQGYGVHYEQGTEDVLKIATQSDGVLVTAQTNASDNAPTTVRTSVLKGTSAFLTLNSTPTRGNVLGVYRTGDQVEFTLTPSIEVPLILDVTRNQGTDAFAFYAATVNGQPQVTGSSFMSWHGIGQGCVAFDGSPMQSFYGTVPDRTADSQLHGYNGYGLYWSLPRLSGRTSFYGTFYAPQGSETSLEITGAADSANLVSTMGEGARIIATDQGNKVTTLEEIIGQGGYVQNEKICVKGGDYYWNNTGVREQLIDQINSRENSCIPS